MHFWELLCVVGVLRHILVSRVLVCVSRLSLGVGGSSIYLSTLWYHIKQCRAIITRWKGVKTTAVSDDGPT